MREENVQFYSEGHKLQATIYYPDEMTPGEKYPAIVPNSGYQGFNEFYPRMFAKTCTDAGYICLGFDYRGFAESEGMKGHVILDEQVADIYNAVTFISAQNEVDEDRVALIGWGMGASNVIREAANDTRVKAVGALNGFYDGERWLRAIHTYPQFVELCEMVEADRTERVLTGESKKEDPFIHYPLDPATADYVKNELEAIDGFGNLTTLQFTESILRTNAEVEALELEDTPVFVGHGKDNLLHPVEEALSLYEVLPGPAKLSIIDGKHNDFMYQEHPVYTALMEELLSFFAEALADEKTVTAHSRLR
ncbi:hypothetical protein B0H94_10454 [Salsuginibacillus halophilus]|uniref:Xaa-Pro dipeptidyl-peptidase-like domain-containing protein n=1 Tax=Salsuginibacillus halophilus TaxID=517424 RepID=A0A2P8HQJ3_9BACI|nr:alpha/beta hydrolase [Salsuginibacillus halophilus]PSL48454.1 hypothetical protein B0H94_10454 [Salsuginibacillus halophilus]